MTEGLKQSRQVSEPYFRGSGNSQLCQRAPLQMCLILCSDHAEWTHELNCSHPNCELYFGDVLHEALS